MSAFRRSRLAAICIGMGLCAMNACTRDEGPMTPQQLQARYGISWGALGAAMACYEEALSYSQTRVMFDRRLRTPPQARVLSTPEAGPVIIVTTAAGAAQADRRGVLEARGAQIEVAANGTLRAALERLAARQIESLLLEGGGAVHNAGWDEGLVDYVRLYVTPKVLGAEGLPLLPDRAFSSADLRDRRISTLGPDVLIEGYVHRTR